jgi:hypothetical protein
MTEVDLLLVLPRDEESYYRFEHDSISSGALRNVVELVALAGRSSASCSLA